MSKVILIDGEVNYFRDLFLCAEPVVNYVDPTRPALTGGEVQEAIRDYLEGLSDGFHIISPKLVGKSWLSQIESLPDNFPPEPLSEKQVEKFFARQSQLEQSKSNFKRRSR